MIALAAGQAVLAPSYCMDTAELRKVVLVLEDREALADIAEICASRAETQEAQVSALRAALDSKTEEARIWKQSLATSDSARRECVEIATRDEKLPSRKTVAAITAVVTALIVLFSD